MNKILVSAMAFLAVVAFSGVVAAQDVTDSSSSATADGGTVNNQNLTIQEDAQKWTGFFGTLDASATLTGSSGNTFFEWTTDDVTGSAVFAVNSSQFADASSLSSLSPVTSGTDAESVTGINSGTEKASDTYTTFTGEVAALTLGQTANATTSTTDGGTGFETLLYQDGSANPVYVGEAQEGATAYDGSTEADYQILAGAPSSTTFDFYAQIN